jgi:hypothetical protein
MNMCCSSFMNPGIMTNYKCYICETDIIGAVYKGYDQSFCSNYCRNQLIQACDYNHQCDLVKKPTQPKNPKPYISKYNPAARALFDLSSIDIHYASYDYHGHQNSVNVVYKRTPSLKTYINIFCKLFRHG